MKHAATVILAAGIAGAAWFRPDSLPQHFTGKIQVPDPGPSDINADKLLADLAPDWRPDAHEALVPMEPAPTDQVAERPSRIQTISDELPFAVSEDSSDSDVPVNKSKRSPADAFPNGVETQPRTTKTPAEFQSAEGRPITIRRLGEGRYRIVILTGLDGRDRTAVRWGDDLVEALEQRADLLQQQEFVIIRAANPDGLAAKVRENGHGVVLNRNFPTKRYRLDVAGATGAGPASEPETRAVLQTLYDLRPHRVIHLSSTTGNPGAYYNPSARDVAERLQRQSGLHAERLDFDKVPGSVEEFVDATWTVGVMRLNLRGVPDDDVPRKVMPLVISAVTDRETAGSGAVAPVSTPRREPSRWQTGPTSSPVPTGPANQTPKRNRTVIRRGYEELPPPPQ